VSQAQYTEAIREKFILYVAEWAGRMRTASDERDFLFWAQGAAHGLKVARFALEADDAAVVAAAKRVSEEALSMAALDIDKGTPIERASRGAHLLSACDELLKTFELVHPRRA
jgi:hypothetical protein